MTGIDRNRVRDSFDRHASEYDLHSGVQKLVIARITELLHELQIDPRRVLDIGSGTGLLLKNLSALFPQARLVGLDLAYSMCLAARANQRENLSLSLLTGDAETLPFLDQSFALIVSTSTFQWLGELDRVFSETFRVLAPEGRLLFAMFGERTLFELRGSYRQAWEGSGRGAEERTHSFPFLCEIGTALFQAGFSDVRVFSEREVEYHHDVPSLLRSLKGIGAANASPVRSRGLAERRVMLEMMDIYRREHGVDGLIPATYEVIYGIASKPSGERNT